jgi:outer membrane protein assembly factor BamB
MTHADPKGAEQWAIAVDVNTGKIIHDIKLFTNTAPEPLGTDGNTYASPSVVSSNGRVFLHFGTYGTAALDAKSGKVLWTRRDLNCQHYRGPGSSPVIYGNLLICTYDGIDVQFVAALDVRTGSTVWKTARSIDWNLGKSNEVIPDMRKAYSTPIVVKRSGQDELITVGARAFIA